MPPSQAHLRAGGRRRVPAVTALLAALALAAGGCSSSGSSSPSAQGPGGSGTATSQMASTVALGKVAGNVQAPFHRRFAAQRQSLEQAVGQAVDSWLDGGYVGVSYPRDSFGTAFTSFTPDARKDAERDKRLMTLWSDRHRIDGVTTTHRTISIDVLAPRGKPAGATARVDLRFTTSGQVTQHVQVTGRLFLAPDAHGTWRVFGYDISKGAR